MSGTSIAKAASAKGNQAAAGPPGSIAILGVPFDRVTYAETVRLVERMIASRRPHYLATANVDFVVRAQNDIELRRILFDADLVLCDGAPLVWASRLLGNPLPERVAGADLVPMLLERGKDTGLRVFFLGGTPDILERAVANVRSKYRGVVIAGAFAPPFKPLLEMDHAEITRRVADAKPDLLLVSFGCPKQEKWIWMHYRQLGVPVSVGVGATVDFLAGAVSRAPVWMQRCGLEWVYRLCQEPRRLFKRYFTDIWVFGLAILRQLAALRSFRRAHPDQPTAVAGEAVVTLAFPARFDAQEVDVREELWSSVLEKTGGVVADLSRVRFIDSTGIGLLVRLAKRLRGQNRRLILAQPSESVLRALKLMKLESFFKTAADPASAETLAAGHGTEGARTVLTIPSASEALAWGGEVTASNTEEIWSATKPHLDWCARHGARATIRLNAVTFLDSSGLGLMLRVRRYAREHGCALCFEDASDAVRNVARLAKLESMLLDPPTA